MKRVFIVHCWEGYPEYCWYPYVKRELEAKGFTVTVPAFPETDAPQLTKWLPMLKKEIGLPDENTYLIGHSVGCIMILRYLESLAPGQKVGGAVSVAGYTDDLGFPELANFFTAKIPFSEIKTKANKFIAIHSDDDPYVALKYGEILKEKLGAELIIKHQFKHFSGPAGQADSCLELPDVVESVLRLANHD